MKKNVAIAMSAMMMAGTVVPAFAAEEQQVGVERVNLNIINGTQEATHEMIAQQKLVLEKVKQDMEQKYYEETAEGKVWEYSYAVTKEDNTNTKLNEREVTFTFTNKDGVKRSYVFIGAEQPRTELDPEFGQDYKVQKVTINYAATDGPARLAKLQKLLVNNTDYRVDHEVIRFDGTKGDYRVNIFSTLSGIKLAEVTITDAPVDPEFGEIPSTTDFMNHWAKANIEDAMINKWIDTTATFRPNDQITRAEFIKVVNKAFGLDASTPRVVAVEFDDVNFKNWFYKDVAIAIQHGYINGYERTETVTDEQTGETTTVVVKEFKPNQPITRQEASKIISAIINNGNLDDGGLDIVTDFADDKDIANWADQAVQNLANKGVVNGYADDTFRPNNKITRAESVVMMQRAAKIDL